jgi:hypothetical protein
MLADITLPRTTYRIRAPPFHGDLLGHVINDLGNTESRALIDYMLLHIIKLAHADCRDIITKTH